MLTYFKLALYVATGTGEGGRGGGRKEAFHHLYCGVFVARRVLPDQGTSIVSLQSFYRHKLVHDANRRTVHPTLCTVSFDSSNNAHAAYRLLKSPGRRYCGTTTLRYARIVSIPLQALFICLCRPRCHQSTTLACSNEVLVLTSLCLLVLPSTNLNPPHSEPNFLQKKRVNRKALKTNRPMRRLSSENGAYSKYRNDGCGRSASSDCTQQKQALHSVSGSGPSNSYLAHHYVTVDISDTSRTADDET